MWPRWDHPQTGTGMCWGLGAEKGGGLWERGFGQLEGAEDPPSPQLQGHISPAVASPCLGPSAWMVVGGSPNTS